MIYVKIRKVTFPGKNPNLKEVEKYLNSELIQGYYVEETNDYVRIGAKSVDEYCGSAYTKRLRGALLKAKANAATVLPELIRTACNRRWLDNKAEKHSLNASKGWYRYDVGFSIPVYDDNGRQMSENIYSATLVARINDKGLFFHDVINIKKEASKPFESQ